MSTARRGRPPLTWLVAEALAELPAGTAVTVEKRGRHVARVTGRLVACLAGELELDTPRGEVIMELAQVKRARIAAALYEPGDPVLLRHVPASEWRGGVVRTQGTDVLVEQIDGTFAWHTEADLEPADARDPVLPPVNRGPVPSRVP